MVCRDTAKVRPTIALRNDKLVEIGNGVLIDVLTEYRGRLILFKKLSDLTRFRVNDRAEAKVELRLAELEELP